MHKPILVTAAILCGWAAPALAGGGGVEGDWELGAYLGSSHPDSYNPLDPENGDLYGARVGYFFTRHWSVEGSYQAFSTEGKIGGQTVDVNLDALRVNALFNFRPDKKFRWFLTAGLGSEKTESDDISESDLGVNVGGGARWFFGRQRHWGLRADARWIEVDVGGDIDETQSNYEGTGGIVFAFGGGPPPDGDGDGVPDKKDNCDFTPKGAVIDAAGCPQDADGDRVYDGLDKCPGTQRGWAVDTAGCPADADGDGVWDGADKCPGTPKGSRVDDTGCPVVEAAPPPPAPVIPEAMKPLVLEGVTFAINSSVLTPESSVVLDRVASSLKEHPEVRLEVGGHTDSNGDAARNLGLSTARAESVRTYLIGKGVPAGQLASKGYGSQRPVADNSTEAGRALNRRVELSRIP